MNVISQRGLMRLAARHPETIAVVKHLYRIARKAKWNGLHEVQKAFPSADQVGSVLIFNVLGGN